MGVPGRCSPYRSLKTLALLNIRENWSAERVEAFLHPGFEDLEVISVGKVGGRERVPFS